MEIWMNTLKLEQIKKHYRLNFMVSDEFNRKDNLFSLCGLNCNLCPMFIRKECGGCFSDSPCYLTCPIAPCSVKHGNVEYCFECEEYPCEKYDGIDLHDSLISHLNQKKDMEKAKTIGIENYKAEQRLKKEILDKLLKEYDSGDKDVFFCLAVNLMEISDLNNVLDETNKVTMSMSLDEKSLFIKNSLNNCAEKNGIILKLRH